MGKAQLVTQILFSSFFIFLVFHFCPAISQEVEDTTAFDYLHGSIRGPTRWGRIRREWRMCSNGTMQSPIDLLDLRVQAVSQFEKIRNSYKPSTATLKNRGHDIMLKWKSGAAGYIEINRTRYLLQQCHWHSPSEHTINGRRFDLELHIVHQSRTGQIAVIGIMYRIGTPDSFLSAMASRIRAIANSTNQERTVAGVVDPRRRIRISSKQYYKYIGSLTVPPCTQNVVWLVSNEIRTVAKRQVSLLQAVVNDGSKTNARPLQRKNGRSVQLYGAMEVNNEDERT